MGTTERPQALPERVTTVARRIDDRATELGSPEAHAQKDRVWKREVLDPLRRLNKHAENRLREHCFLAENVGAECVRIQGWKEQRQQTADKHLYLYLLRDCIECHFLFYKHFQMFEDDAVFREAVSNNQIGSRSERKIVATLNWLDHIDAPTELDSRQAQLATFTQGQVG